MACSICVALFRNSSEIKFILLIIVMIISNSDFTLSLSRSFGFSVFTTCVCVWMLCCTVAFTQMKFSTLVSYMSYANWFNQILFLCSAHFPTAATASAAAAITVATTHFIPLLPPLVSHIVLQPTEPRMSKWVSE